MKATTSGRATMTGTTAMAVAPSCHACANGSPAPAGAPVIGLVGAPNSGKSTLFNALTGAKAQMGNWPGTTVEISRGAWKADDVTYDVIDFPGAYSLDAMSPDAELTREMLINRPEGERRDGNRESGRPERAPREPRERRETDAQAIAGSDVALQDGTVLDLVDGAAPAGERPTRDGDRPEGAEGGRRERGRRRHRPAVAGRGGRQRLHR